MSKCDLSTEQLQGLPDSLSAEVQERWEAFRASFPEVAALVWEDSRRLAELIRVWSVSEYVWRACERHPEMLHDLLVSGDLGASLSGEALASALTDALSQVSEQAELERLLRLWRRREMVRIAWRDLSALASLEQTLEALTTLADTLTGCALDKLHEWLVAAHGEPVGRDGVAQRMTVLGMGKLGGRELNYSSDIDLMFVYPGPGETNGRRVIDSEAFFRRLGQKLIKVLTETTADGFVFRVDMRLRPFGDAGPLAIHVSAMEHYYQTHGREWERYAMVKARPIAGDLEVGRELLERLRPFVYRRYLDYGSIESLRGMKAMIASEMERKGVRRNIKLGPGGIREIEFIVQAFQLIHGGRRPELRQRELNRVLDALEASRDLPADAVADLRAAYAFLRTTENRLQAFADRQTHELPREDASKTRLAFAMGFPDWRAFVTVLTGHVSRVEKQFAMLFSGSRADAEDTPSAGDLAIVWSGAVDEQTFALLAEQGYQDPQAVHGLLTRLKSGFAYRSLTTSGRQRLDRLMPLLLGDATHTNNPDETLERVLSLVETVARRSNYLALLVEHPLALSQLIRLCSASPWISEYLRKHPLLLDELLTPTRLYEPLRPGALALELETLLERVVDEDLEQHMDMLRHFQQINVLRVAAADITGAMGLMVVSDCLTWIAEAVLRQALELAWRDLSQRLGQPSCEIDGHSVQPGFAIIAYGKLGGLELGYGSDLDLVFLHDSRGSKQWTDGKKQLDNATFFARLAQRLIHIVATRTAAGVLYEVDTRLRPSGRSGLLVSSVEAFSDYQESSAWTWEHQALVRARVVAGSESIGRQFEAIRESVLCRTRDADALKSEVCNMRERMRAQLGASDSSSFHLKQDPGGIADIEFMVQYEILAGAHSHHSLAMWSDNVRQLDELYATGLLDAENAELLREAYRTLRQLLHRLTLEGKPEQYPEQALSETLRRLRQGVVEMWHERMERPPGDPGHVHGQ